MTSLASHNHLGWAPGAQGWCEPRRRGLCSGKGGMQYENSQKQSPMTTQNTCREVLACRFLGLQDD